MQPWTVYFHAHHGIAEEQIEATDAKEALAKARAMADEDWQKGELTFDQYEYGAINGIVVFEEGKVLAEWQSDDLRLHNAAGQMLTALQAPELDAAHDKLSTLLEGNATEHDIRKAAADLC